MPPPAETLFAGDYSAHKAVFDRLCGQPSGGVIVQGAGPSDVPSTLGPVRILDMYTCGGKIGVIGMVPTAEVRLFRGLTLVASKVPRGELAEFDLSELGPGGMSGTWTAFQRIGSVTSPPSLSVMARNIAADFPGALPAPLLAVSPATHACAQSVAVGHVPGATLEVRRIRAGVPTTRLNGGSSRGSTGALADAAFNTQDSISVRQQCGTGPWSGWSTPGRMPRVEPLPLPQPGIDNNEVFVGQSFVVVTGLIAGARTELGPVSTSSWPIYQQWIDIGGPLGRPLVSTDALPAGFHPEGTTFGLRFSA